MPIFMLLLALNIIISLGQNCSFPNTLKVKIKGEIKNIFYVSTLFFSMEETLNTHCVLFDLGETNIYIYILYPACLVLVSLKIFIKTMIQTEV